MSLRVLIVTNLFADPFNSSRATFNQQQFARLAQHVELSVIVPVSCYEVLRRPLAYGRLRKRAQQQWPFVDYVVSWYVPRVGRRLHAACLFLSLVLQRLPTFFLQRWDCMFASWGYPDAVALAAIARLAGVPMITKVHGSDINVFAEEPARRVQIRWALNRSRHVVAVSQALMDRMGEIGVDRARITVLYNGVDPARFHPVSRSGARHSLGLDETQRVILFVGNIQSNKGCGELLYAFARLHARDAGVRLALVGTGPMKAQLLESSARLGCADAVRFVGRVAHEQIVQWFGAADLLCLPSHAEGVPNVILEAMACGTPVVATRVGGIPEILPAFAGVMVPPRDVAALEQALSGALQATWDRERIVAHARGFDWERNVARLHALIADAVHAPPVAAVQ